MVIQITTQEVLKSHVGRILRQFYHSTSNSGPVSEIFDEIIEFLNEPTTRERMKTSEIHHERPALAGIIRELERLPKVDAYFRNETLDPLITSRLRQGVGVMVKIVMELEGWEKTGKKMAVGRRAELGYPEGTYNRSGLSRWFYKTERYEPKPECPDYKLWKEMKD